MNEQEAQTLYERAKAALDTENHEKASKGNWCRTCRRLWPCPMEKLAQAIKTLDEK